MGLLGKLFGRPDDDAASPLSRFDADEVRAPLSELIEALGGLADAMDTDDAPISNPGWRGRLRDLRDVRGDLRLLSRKPTFTRDEVFEVLTRVRPLYRGAPPKDFAHLAPLNDAVVERIEALYTAAS